MISQPHSDRRRSAGTLTTIMIFVTAMTIAALSVRAEIITGANNFADGLFDFGTQQTTLEYFDSDVLLVDIFEPPLGWKIAGRFGIVRLSVCFDSVITAPTDTSLYDVIADIVVGDTYVVITEEGHYAKLTLTNWIEFGDAPFIYNYQDDGSNILEPGVGVEVTTWGRIKAILK